jgi:hypothetical protein
MPSVAGVMLTVDVAMSIERIVGGHAESRIVSLSQNDAGSRIFSSMTLTLIFHFWTPSMSSWVYPF